MVGSRKFRALLRTCLALERPRRWPAARVPLRSTRLAGALFIATLVAPIQAVAQTGGAMILINQDVPLSCQFASFGPATPSGSLELEKGRSVRVGSFFGCNTSRMQVPISLSPAKGVLGLNDQNYAKYSLNVTWRKTPTDQATVLVDIPTVEGATPIQAVQKIDIVGYQGKFELALTLVDVTRVNLAGEYTETITLTVG